jgi:tetratricopeptide (TPR) repeat protein
LDKAKKENIFNICLKKMEKHLDVSVFSNIFNLLEKERITEIKQAYIDWIVFYLNQGQYKHALKKFSLIEAIAKKPAQMSADFPGLEARITQLFHLKECANALNRFSKNDYEGAVERYKIVITKTPSNIEAHFGLAKCYRRLGENIKRDRRFDIVDASVEARVATGQLKELAVIMSDEEKDFYNKAEKYFNLGLELLNETFADPHIYSELACLKELRGNFSEAAEDRLEAVEGNQEMFYENYRQLATQEYDSKLFCVTLRFDFFMHDEAFAQYCVDRKFHENYMSGLHLDCGVIYECNDFFDLAMQQYLLALNLSKSIEQSTKILEILNLLFEYFSILKQDIPASVFQNIINITNAQELIMIKCAYVLWIKSDFDANKYQAAARKCVLIDQPTRPFFLNMPNKLAVLRTADFFFEMGDEYSRLNKSDLAVCAYDKCLELNASYPEAGAKREYLLAAAQKPADVYVQKSSPALFAQSSPIDENAGCKVAELAL